MEVWRQSLLPRWCVYSHHQEPKEEGWRDPDSFFEWIRQTFNNSYLQVTTLPSTYQQDQSFCLNCNYCSSCLMPISLWGIRLLTLILFSPTASANGKKKLSAWEGKYQRWLDRQKPSVLLIHINFYSEKLTAKQEIAYCCIPLALYIEGLSKETYSFAS